MNSKKSFTTAVVAAALVLGTGVVAGVADTPSPSPTTSSSASPSPTLTDKQKARLAKQAALAKYRADLAAWLVQKQAWDASAKPIIDAYQAAVTAAKATRDAALAKLPTLPPRPRNPFGGDNNNGGNGSSSGNNSGNN